MKIITDMLAFISIIASMLITALTVEIMGNVNIFLALVSLAVGIGYIYTVFYSANAKEKSQNWNTRAIVGFFLVLFVNFIGCSGVI